MKSTAAGILLLIVTAASCGDKRSADQAIPRRYGYPRIEVYDTIYHRVDIGPVAVDVNAGADVSSQREGWLNIAYPRYGATLYLSALRTDDPGSALQNRRQRISLNLGGAHAVTHRFAAGHYECMVVESTDAGSTPVQLLAVSSEGIVVSGTATLTGPSAPADSIRPIADALTQDAIKLLMSLQ